VLVEWEELPKFSSRVVMVDGSFDPLHEGHIAYFQAASQLGLPLLCNISSDAWTASKHPIMLSQSNRAVVIGAIRYIQYVHCSQVTTSAVLRQLRPTAYVKGADWKLRGGIPTEEQKICDELRIQVNYVETVRNSSTKLIEQLRSQ